MNLKRAFLAAIAVLMMPGLAMAQSTSTFPGGFEFVPLGGEAKDAKFDLTLTCNGGTPLTQTISVGDGEVINFTVISGVGATCNFALSGLPDTGWDLTDNGNCTGITAIDGANPACEFYVEPTPFNFWVDLSWMANSDTASDVPVSGDLMLECASVWDGMAVTTVTESYMGITDASAGPNYILPGTYAPHPDGSTVCSASLMVDDSAVEVDNSACSNVSVKVGDPAFLLDADGNPIVSVGEVVVCDIEASVFFEGIPTLSQYGMAVMVLLMLGVGFVGFRRFV